MRGAPPGEGTTDAQPGIIQMPLLSRSISSLGFNPIANGPDMGLRSSVSSTSSHAMRPGVRVASVSLPGITHSGCIYPCQLLSTKMGG